MCDMYEIIIKATDNMGRGMTYGVDLGCSLNRTESELYIATRGTS